MSSDFLIYGLVDPRTDELRYIGRSVRGMLRPVSHWKTKKFREAKDHCHGWVRNVLAEGLIPEIIVIEEFIDLDDSIINDAEMFWIAYFRSIGCRLTNMTNGGEGSSGLPPWCKGKRLSEETRKKQSVAAKGRASPTKGKKLSLEHRMKIGAAHKGRKYSDDFKMKISMTSKGRVPWNKGKSRGKTSV